MVAEILANALVVILPTQNPDGREIGQRRNLNGFDMNRDWFARTQPETDGKLEVVRQYPPMLYIDAHEFGLPNYFFPPNADPEYHEIPDTAHDWINELYCAGDRGGVRPQGIKYFHGAPYDFFAIVFGDTVPTTGFHAAGMTFEKESGDPISEREHEQFVSIWASVFAGGAATARRLAAGTPRGSRPTSRASPASWSRTRSSSRATTSTRRCPTARAPLLPAPRPEPGIRARSSSSGGCSGWTSTVYQLTAPLPLADFHPYGDPATSRRCRRGRTGSRWPRPRSTGSRRCSTRTRGSRSR